MCVCVRARPALIPRLYVYLNCARRASSRIARAGCDSGYLPAATVAAAVKTADAVVATSFASIAAAAAVAAFVAVAFVAFVAFANTAAGSAWPCFACFVLHLRVDILVATFVAARKRADYLSRT